MTVDVIIMAQITTIVTMIVMYVLMNNNNDYDGINNIVCANLFILAHYKKTAVFADSRVAQQVWCKHMVYAQHRYDIWNEIFAYIYD